MTLLAYNRSGSPVTLSGLSVVVPASAAPTRRGVGINVTSELRSLTGGQYTALETQRATGAIEYQWTGGGPEYRTGSLRIGPEGWAAQSTWNINPSTGDDDFDGLTSPIKTWAEFRRRVSTGTTGTIPRLVGAASNVVGPIDLFQINVAGSLPSTDPVGLMAEVPDNTLFTIVGTPTTVASGTFTAVTALNRATNQFWEVTDATITWASHIGRRIRVTSGPNAGQVAWIARDMGAGVARVSGPADPLSPTAGPGSLPADFLSIPVDSPGIFSIGDPFVIEDMCDAYVSGDLDIRGSKGGATTAPILAAANLALRNLTGFRLALQPNGNVNTVVKGCRFVHNLWAGNLSIGQFYGNCGYDLGVTILGNPFFLGGLMRGSVGGRGGSGGSVLDDDILLQGAGVDAFSGAIYIGTCGVADRTTDGVRVGSNPTMGTDANILIDNVFSANHGLYGSGNTGKGLVQGAGITNRYGTNIPSITGTTGDVAICGLTVARAWDEAVGAYTEAGAAQTRALTWASLAAAIGAAGFGGNAHNVERNSHFVKRS